jgi:hypothetical protein
VDMKNPLGAMIPQSILINSGPIEKSTDFCGIEGSGQTPQEAEQFLKKNFGLGPAIFPCDMPGDDESGIRVQRELRRLPAMVSRPRNPEFIGGRAGSVPGAVAKADRGQRWPKNAVAADIGIRLVRALQGSGMIAAALLMLAPAQASDIDAEARRLSVLCQRAVEAERVMAGGAEIVWNQWVREKRPSPDEQRIQFQFCERYFAAYSQRTTRQ